MSKNKPKPPVSALAKVSQVSAAGIPPAFNIKYPLLWLALAAFVLYLPTVSMGMTDLDDGIFIKTNTDFNENLSNLFYSFTQSIFNTKADLFYRPVDADVMILNYHLANHGTNIAMFHFVNILLHIISVLLLYKLLMRLSIKPVPAFILTLLFAVHPVLTEAVAWICARIEPLLCIFVLAFFIHSIDYNNKGKTRNLLYSALFLLLALFNKETAVAAAPAAFILLVVVLRKKWLSRPNLIEYGTWAACYAVWFAARAAALSTHDHPAGGDMAGGFMSRLPVMVQYLGKVFFPVNLSVFPLQVDTVYYYGIAAVIVLGVLLAMNRHTDKRLLLGGFCLFFLFLAPTFIIPKSINTQTFEYRMYIPMVGILLLLSQTPLLQNRLPDKQLFIGGIVVCCVLAIVNFRYQQSFADPLSFWTQAEQSAPHSAYAKMMLSARIDDPVRGDQLFLEAYHTDPNERMLNYIYGVRLQAKDSIPESERYLLAEKKKTGYYECDFYLARVAMQKKDYKGAISYLETYIKSDKTNKAANDNLLLLYLDTDQDDKAKAHAQHMKDMGLDVPKAVLEHFHL